MADVPEQWQEISESSDFKCHQYETDSEPYLIGYLKTLTDPKILNELIVESLAQHSDTSLDRLFPLIPVAEKEIVVGKRQIQDKMLRGYVAIQKGYQSPYSIMVNAAFNKGRNVAAGG